MSGAIETKGVYYRSSSEFAIRNLTLNVPAGALYGFLGPNGCGKTTTIRLLLGLLKADSGDIRILGDTVPEGLPAVLSAEERRACLAVAPQARRRGPLGIRSRGCSSIPRVSTRRPSTS